MVQISNMLIPALIFYIVAMGLSQKKDIYASFTKGAKDGMKTVAGIVPTLIGLMIAVGVLRASGFLEFAGQVIGGIIAVFSDNFPLRGLRHRWRLPVLKLYFTQCLCTLWLPRSQRRDGR